MAEGFSTAAANAVLNTQGSTYSWIKLHVGAPGANGTSNAATETTRKQATWGSASGASMTTTADLVWTGVAGSEDFTHYSEWSASSGGTFGGSGVITANAVTSGDTFTIPAGSLVQTIPVAS
jgi:hypothetical protein